MWPLEHTHPPLSLLLSENVIVLCLYRESRLFDIFGLILFFHSFIGDLMLRFRSYIGDRTLAFRPLPTPTLFRRPEGEYANTESSSEL